MKYLMYYYSGYIQFVQMHNYNASNAVIQYTGDYLWLCADSMRTFVKAHLAEIDDPNVVGDKRPYFDAEWGPAQKMYHNADIDKEWYFFHAFYSVYSHLASGGAGTGLHWPYRCDTGGTYYGGMVFFGGQDWYFGGGMPTGAVRAMYFLLAEFLKGSGINFANFPHHPMSVGTGQNVEVTYASDPLGCFVTGCTDGRQAMIFVAREIHYLQGGTGSAALTINALFDGRYVVDIWEGWNVAVLAYDLGNQTPASLPSLNPDDFRVASRRHVTVSGGTVSLDNLTMERGLLLTIRPE